MLFICKYFPRRSFGLWFILFATAAPGKPVYERRRFHTPELLFHLLSKKNRWDQGGGPEDCPPEEEGGREADEEEGREEEDDVKVVVLVEGHLVAKRHHRAKLF